MYSSVKYDSMRLTLIQGIVYIIIGFEFSLCQTVLNLASFPGLCVGGEKRAWYTLRMLSFPRISGNLETPIKSAQLH